MSNTISCTVTLPRIDAFKARQVYDSMLGVMEESGFTTADCNTLWPSHLTIAAFLAAEDRRLPDQLDDVEGQFNGRL